MNNRDDLDKTITPQLSDADRARPVAGGYDITVERLRRTRANHAALSRFLRSQDPAAAPPKRGAVPPPR